MGRSRGHVEPGLLGDRRVVVHLPCRLLVAFHGRRRCESGCRHPTWLLRVRCYLQMRRRLPDLQYHNQEVGGSNTFQTKDQFFGSFCLFSQNGLRLTTKTLLFSIITSSALGKFGFLGLFVLRHLEFFMFITVGTVSPPCFGYIHHFAFKDNLESPC